MPPYSLAEPPVVAFILIPLALAGALAWGLWAASGRRGDHAARARRVAMAVMASAAWMILWALVAGSGVLRQWEAMPPPFGALVASVLVVSIWLAFGPWGRVLVDGLPLWTLVAVQSFRLPLELAMHAMSERGIMPEQMSYSGRNFDILTGATAIVVAWLARSGRGGRGVVLAWNVMGLALLVNVVAVAILSTPAIRYFGDDRLNVWVTYVPFVWLPAVMVTAALAGHLLVFRALRARTRS